MKTFAIVFWLSTAALALTAPDPSADMHPPQDVSAASLRSQLLASIREDIDALKDASSETSKKAELSLALRNLASMQLQTGSPALPALGSWEGLSLTQRWDSLVQLHGSEKSRA